MGTITMIPAAELEPGAVFSTDGTIVTAVVPCRKGTAVYVEGVCHGALKTAELAADFPCPIWAADDSPIGSFVVSRIGDARVLRDRLEGAQTATRLCLCPDDCGCHSPYRRNVCGCRAHELEAAAS